MIENASQAFMEIRGLLSLRQLLLEQRWFLHHLGTADGVLPEIGRNPPEPQWEELCSNSNHQKDGKVNRPLVHYFRIF